jgi:pimeloyl-ACP methyl ester carboxylesterase
MVYWTTKRTLANDLLVGIKHMQDLEKERNGNDKVEVVLVGHSSGGGLSQFLLSEGDVKAKALILIGSIPGFGS